MVRKIRYSLLAFGMLLLSIYKMEAQLDIARVMLIGKNALYFKDYIVSIGYFNQVIEVRPWMAEPYYFRAVSKYMLGDLQGANQDATLALERNAFISHAYMLRGIVRHALGEHTGAVADLSHSLLITPDDQEVAFNLAAAQLGANEYLAADSTITHLIRRNAQHAQAHLLRADILLHQKDTLQATQEIGQALQIDSTQAQAYAFRAMLYARKKDYKTALSDLNRALHFSPNSREHYINRGLTRYQLNDYVGAIEDYTSAINIAPADPIARYNRALLRATVGDANNALEDLSVVLEAQPNNYMALYNKGLLSMEVGDFRTALTCFDHVLQQYPYFQMGLLARANAKRGLGDLAGADRDSWRAYQQQKGRIKKEPTNKGKTTRSEKDETIERYNELVETMPSAMGMDDKATLPQSLRGRVQDTDVTIAPQQAFALNFFHAHTLQGIPPRIYQSVEVAHYNEAHPHAKLRFLVSPINQTLDSLSTTELREQLLTLDAHPAEEVDFYLRRGITSFLLVDFKRSLADLDHALTLDPSCSLTYFMRSTVLLKSQELQRVLPSEEVGFLAPTPEQRNNLGIVQTQKPALESKSSIRGLNAALEDVRKAIAQAPKFAYAYYNKALIHALMGQMDEAINDYTKALELGGHDLPEAYFNRGLLYLSQGKKEEAIKDLGQAGEGGIFQAYNIIKRIQEQP